MYFILKTHSVLRLLLYNGKLYVHFGGSLEYWINEYEYEYEQATVSFISRYISIIHDYLATFLCAN